MLDWIISLGLAVILSGLGIFAHHQTGTTRHDGRAHLVPWRAVMIGCVFGVFLIFVHIANLVGIETGPENSPFGRF